MQIANGPMLVCGSDRELCVKIAACSHASSYLVGVKSSSIVQEGPCLYINPLHMLGLKWPLARLTLKRIHIR